MTAVCILTVLATIVGHSDGSGATTYLIVIPPFLMIYKRLNMRPLVLMCLVSITAGVIDVYKRQASLWKEYFPGKEALIKEIQDAQ